MKKFFVVLIFGLASILALNTSSYATEELNLEELKEEYEEHLAIEIENAKGEELKELLTVFEQYESLTEDEQYDFIELINNPDVMEGLFEELSDTEITFSSNGVYRTVSDSSSNIIFEDTVEDGYGITAGEFSVANQNRVATWRRNVRISGVLVMQHTSRIDYSRTKYGGRITGINGSDHYMSRNFTLNSASYSGKSETYGSSYARSTSNMTISIISKYVPGGTYKSGRVGIRVDTKGNVTGFANAD